MLKFKQIILIIIISLLLILNMTFSYATQTGKAKEDAKLRKEQSNTSTILEIIPKDDEFEILEKVGEWYRVNYKKIKGYVLNEFVEELNEDSSEEENNKEEQTNENTVEETTKEELNDTNEVVIGQKAYLAQSTKIYLRPIINAKSDREIESKKEVNVIEILNYWAYIEFEGNTGWINLNKLTSKKENNQEETKKEEHVYLNKTAYVITDGINFRQEPNTDSKILKTFLQNAKITILEETGDWYKIKHNEQEGYILKMYVSEKKTEVTSRSSQTRKVDRKTKTQEDKVATIDTTSTSSKGQEVVSIAKSYLGSKYVYGGASPSGFDCSGFTMYIYKKFGVSLPHSATSQSKIGIKVEKEELQPGDIVFFSNYKTYKGIGHCGIYIGDGKFIHASTEKTGVITSSLNSGSYVKRYVTATRVI